MGKKGRLPYADIMNLHNEVTGSGNLVNVKFPNGDGFMFAVDFGLFQEKRYSRGNYSLEFKPKELDFVLVTHNHCDHTGRIPMLVNKGYKRRIYASKSTCKLLPLALEDSYKIQKEDAKRDNKPCIYREKDVSESIMLLNPCEYNKPAKVNKYTRVTTLENGHLPGAAMFLVQISYPGYDDINLLFTGDYNSWNMFFYVSRIRKWITKLPITVITEATYGDMDSSEIKPCFKQNVSNWLKNGNRTVIALVCSLQSAQTILYELKVAQQQGLIDPEIPIYYDGKLSHKYTIMYINDGLDNKPEMRDFLPENLVWVDKATRNVLLTSKERKIIVTTSAMGLYGPAQAYIPKYIGRDDTLIHFTCYTPEGTLGDILKKTEIGEVPKFRGIKEARYATVEYTNEYSGHAKADKLIALLKQFKNLKLVLINHGETSKKLIFQERVVEEVAPKNAEVLSRDYFFRVNSYGLVKKMTTKFAPIPKSTRGNSDTRMKNKKSKPKNK